jgi:hypothetical protein
MAKKRLLAAILMAMSIPAVAQVGVSVNIGEPGFYGQINIGNAPSPQLIYTQPVIVAPAPQFAGAPPIYLYVPPGYAEHWSDHCGQYHACGRPVYFVRENWYRNTYVPYYHRAHGHPEHRDEMRGHREDTHAHDRGHDDENRHGRDHDDHHGR